MTLSLASCHAEKVDSSVSGEIITGYRGLTINPDRADNQLTVYRGDYIKFSYPKTFTPLALMMTKSEEAVSPDGVSNLAGNHSSAGLEVSIPSHRGNIFPEHKKSPFFRMSETGYYSFTIGDGAGSITVIDLIRPNYTEVTADEAAELIENLQPFILDVRTHGEYRQAHIAGTHLIPIQHLQARIAELESHRHEDIFIYCATGNRSTVASRILADRGFKRIYNLRYGIYDWARKGYPYQSGK